MPDWRRLPVIESCDGCGACCQVVTHPPFYSVFHELGEEAWERLKRERRDLMLEIVADYRAACGRRADVGDALPLVRPATRGDAAITNIARSPAASSPSARTTAATPAVGPASRRSPDGEPAWHSWSRTCWTPFFWSQVRKDSCSSLSSTSVALAESSGETR